ncbi:MAG: pyruvate:ferredoxin (flavodoxin) oxidoreductase [Deltaproteobacteria bacterium]|jgi:pyruvate-ferredoxin/flavodoxin oxidoreductase|nr:pyruvate:ferredoxin (flavodoxin) oxidoreductase [Deltaproteobacteria bacterium]
MTKRRTKTMDGNTAAAYVSYPFTEVAGIFPITPSSEMAELADAWSVEGKKNLFGRPVRVMEMQSEGGASGTLHGVLQAGALGTTYTASQGLLLMIPNMNRIAGELLPAVFHVASRGAGTNSFSIFGDHHDVMATRQSGFAMLSSRSPQDAMYLGAVAHLTAIKASLPVMHFFDGFRTSHEMQKVSLLEYEELNNLLDHDAVAAFRARSISPIRPHALGMTNNPDIYFQLREAINPHYERFPSVLSHYMNEINKITGMSYDFFTYYGHPEAERVIIAMGSGCSVLEETVQAMLAAGEKVGMVCVHLFRPFIAAKLIEKLPASVKKVAVLDRTKEPGAREPLFLDVRAALYEMSTPPVVVGGRFGLASKEFTPMDAQAVFANLALDRPKDNFTVGINDDLSHTSLPPLANPLPVKQPGVTSCVFWGLGSDGTVGANKSSVKIIGDQTDLYAQAYFAYDSKKSGGVTMSHLRFGPNPIKSSYRIYDPDFVACHNPAYVHKYDMMKGLRPGGTFLLNCPWTEAELGDRLPASIKRYIAANDIKLYIINAVDIAIELGLAGRINMIMQSAFFALAKIIPLEEAMKHLRASVDDAYGKQGQSIVDKNLAALERGVSALREVTIPADWKNASDQPKTVNASRKSYTESAKPEFYHKVVQPILDQKGDDLPVSAFKDIADGRWPFNISLYEKRGIAVQTARWKPENCIQCNQCSFICPHAVLRPRLLTDEEKAGAPEGLKTIPATGFPDMHYHLAVSSLDCTGCMQCVGVCPAKNKALEMARLTDQLPQASDIWEYAEHQVPYRPLPEGAKINVKNSQFLQPMLAFSGACAGCGETPYAKLLTQLYGDHMMIAAPAGCSTVWAAGSPTVSYTTNNQGNGPAWGYSLFEDAGEYGFGMLLGVQQLRETLALRVGEALQKDYPADFKQVLANWLTGKNDKEGTQNRRYAVEAALADLAKQEKYRGDPLLKQIGDLRDYLLKRSHWVMGGDGWAYDIGYGGLDHVLAQNQDINVLIFDTEVYSNTGGQSSKATPLGSVAQFTAGGKPTYKKDIGAIFMSYRYIYVAQVAIGADKAQCLKALQEAEAYPGPSIVIAYAPCINHGLAGGLTNGLDQEKSAVEVGYWPLYRYNPLLAAKGENPMQLDYQQPNGKFKEHLLREVRYASLFKAFPERAEEFAREAADNAMARYNYYAKLAGK